MTFTFAVLFLSLYICIVSFNNPAQWEALPRGRKRTALLEDDWTKFTNTLGYRELPRLDRLGYNYRVPPPGAVLK